MKSMRHTQTKQAYRRSQTETHTLQTERVIASILQEQTEPHEDAQLRVNTV